MARELIQKLHRLDVISSDEQGCQGSPAVQRVEQYVDLYHLLPAIFARRPLLPIGPQGLRIAGRRQGTAVPLPPPLPREGMPAGLAGEPFHPTLESLDVGLPALRVPARQALELAVGMVPTLAASRTDQLSPPRIIRWGRNTAGDLCDG